MVAIPSFQESQLEMICDILGGTESGTSESELIAFLAASNIKEPLRGETRRRRLFDALWSQQAQDQCANNVVAFIHKAMYHALHRGQMQLFEKRREELNGVLAFSGLYLGSDGRITDLSGNESKVSPQARQRARNLREKLQVNNVHPEIVAACNAEHLIQDNYFPVVLEATRGIAQKIRTKTGLKGAAAELPQRAFENGQRGYPFLALNTLQSEGQRAEQVGFLQLIKGVMSTFAEIDGKPEFYWTIDEQEAFEFLTFLSMVQRRLDKAVSTGQAS